MISCFGCQLNDDMIVYFLNQCIAELRLQKDMFFYQIAAIGLIPVIN